MCDSQHLNLTEIPASVLRALKNYDERLNCYFDEDLGYQVIEYNGLFIRAIRDRKTMEPRVVTMEDVFEVLQTDTHVTSVDEQIRRRNEAEATEEKRVHEYTVAEAAYAMSHYMRLAHPIISNERYGGRLPRLPRNPKLLSEHRASPKE